MGGRSILDKGRRTGILLLVFTSAQAMPTSKHMSSLVSRNDNILIDTGEPPRDRTIFTLLTLVCLLVLSLLLGSRFAKLKQCIHTYRSFMSILVLAMYIVVLTFIIVAASLVAGQGLYTRALCRSAIWVCHLFYTFIKATIYVFLVERIHVVRAPFVSRSKDKFYLGCMTMVAVMYGAVAINAYINVTVMQEDGRCYLGVSRIVSLPFISVNIFTNLVLTGVFFYLLSPVASLQRRPQVFVEESWAHQAENQGPVQRSLRTLLWKSIIGSLLIEIPMAANMIQLVVTGGKELGMICLSICMVDVSWDAFVIHWLTFGTNDAAAQKDLSRATRTSITLRRAGSPDSSQTDINTAPTSLELPDAAYVPEIEGTDIRTKVLEKNRNW
ncbi:hypothetical protein NX059_006721 [Plenodomus lindquistii]|nr:hypothetical protein NX059_006721 [Plenodomus lindquistii]